jgi:mannose-1-phosphate guanylyltransferase
VRAVLLVGGFGTRLHPLTLTTPKPMLPLVDRPMLEWVLEGLRRGGVDEAVLSLGFRPDSFQDAYPDGTCAGVALRYAVEPEPLDTAGAIRFAARAAGIEERFLVVNGDVLTDLDYAALVGFHADRGGEGTIALHRVEDPSAFGVVPTDPDGRVQAFVEKPLPGEAPTDLINAGTYVLEPSVLERIPGDRRVSVERETFPAMVVDRSLFAAADHELAGGAAVYWADTGTPAQYLDAMLDLVAGRRPTAAVPAVSPAATVARDATLDEAIVMAGATVGSGCRLRRCAVLPGATIEADAELDDCIVGPGATVGAGARVLGGAVLGADARVESGATVDGERVPAS